MHTELNIKRLVRKECLRSATLLLSWHVILYMEKTLISFPPRLVVDFLCAENRVRQISSLGNSELVILRPERIGKQDCQIATRDDGTEVLIVKRPVPNDVFAGDILKVDESTLNADILGRETPRVWLRQAGHSNIITSPQEAEQCAKAVLSSWYDRFAYSMEDQAAGKAGLRPPQMGALFATLSHWTVALDDPATIAMPTGTGKTETMLALLVNQRLPRILVTVPNSALREQIANKFLTLGVLKRAGVVADAALFPVVGLIEHHFPDANIAEAFFRSCNVIVATMQAITGCSEEVRRKISELCSHLFIDEAHHVRAPTWDAFRQRFHGKPIVQFTATPFREDGKPIGGKMIYSYPLRKAQEENYFKPIVFRSIFTHVDPDRQIAETAVDQLRKDRTAGLDHLVMARVDEIERAKSVHAIYEEIAPEFVPLCLHSKITDTERKKAIQSLRDRSSRIIVCVNMLGEGFDLPQLKIAALHDIHKSLAITLQFTGRFTRTVSGDKSVIGDATMIANRARLNVREQLRALYSEDPDWNQVIRELAEGKTSEEEQRSTFQRSFNILPIEVPLQNIEPKMSAVVFRMTEGKAWNPDGIDRVFPEAKRYTRTVARSAQHHVAWFVTCETAPVPWGEIKDLEDVVYNFYLLHWDEKRNLLFINSSNNGSVHEDLAKAVGGDDVQLIYGDVVYRALHGITRMVATNLGLLDSVSRTRRFMMLVGADTTEGFDTVQSQSKAKTNLFGHGYENAERVTMGCSRKGRVWSYQKTDDLSEWVKWCHHIGTKLIDDTIDTGKIFKNFLKPVLVQKRPELVPLTIEWPLAFLQQQEDRVTVNLKGEETLFYDVGLEILDYTRDKPIRFRVFTEKQSVQYQISFGAEGTRYIADKEEAQIKIGKRDKPLSEWFQQYGPRIHFEQDTIIEHDLLLRMERDIPPFDPARIMAWSWTGIDIKRESQGINRDASTVQHRAIQNVMASSTPWDVVFDDDDAGEVADVVALRMDNNRLIIHLYHCKYSGDVKPGCRVDDFYAVCGQAQKSVHWRERKGLEKLIPHLIDREQKRLQKGEPTRFEKGDIKALDDIARRMEVLRPEFRIFVVQPGLSKTKISQVSDETKPILDLLATTSLYLHETFNIAFEVIAS